MFAVHLPVHCSLPFAASAIMCEARTFLDNAPEGLPSIPGQAWQTVKMLSAVEGVTAHNLRITGAACHSCFVSVRAAKAIVDGAEIGPGRCKQ